MFLQRKNWFENMKNDYVLITGSSKGLGKSLAEVFAKNNYNIVLHGRNKKDLEKTKKEILEIGAKCEVIAGDLKNIKTLNDIYKTAKDKNISILINNAGVHCPYQPLEKIKDEQIDEIILTNLIAPIKLTKKIYNMFLEKNNGTIININSMSGLKNHNMRTIYCASKWGLRGFSDTFRLESKKHNVRIIDVYPSRIKTIPEFKEGMESKIVAEKIYCAYKDKNKDILEIDDRG